MRLVFGLLVLLLTWHGGMAYICNQLCTCTSDYTCSGCIPYAVTDTSSTCKCDTGYSAYQKGSLSYCIKCDSTCVSCFGPNINNCVSCPNGFTLNSSQSTCTPPNNATVATIESSYKFLGFNLLSTWFPAGTSISNCDIYSLIGGHGYLQAAGTIYTNYATLPGHYQTRVLAAFFWVSSSAKPTFQIKVSLTNNADGAETAVEYAKAIPSDISNGTCAAGQDYWTVNIDQTLGHSATNKRVTFKTDGSNNAGQYWGIRQYVLILNLCYSATCKTCSGPLWNNCDSCADSKRSQSVTGYASQCRCYGTSGNFFRHPDNTVDLCVNPCPSYPSQYYGDETTRNCVTNCPTTAPTTVVGWNMYFADDTLNQCKPTCSTPISLNGGNLDVYHDRTNQKCVTNCPSTQPYSWATNMTCYSVCPNNQFVNLRTMKCIPTCPDTPNPPLFGYLQPTPTTTTSFCVEVCPTGTYADPFTHLCTTACTWGSNGNYFFDTSTGYRKCVLVCPSPNYFGDTSTKTCVQTCPSGTYGDNNSADRYCRGTCTGGWFGLTTGTRICLLDCPYGTWATTVNYTCVTTSTGCGTQYADNNTRSCVNGGSCSLGQFALGTTHMKCVTYCPTGTYGDVNGMCATSCTGLYFSDEDIHLCVTNCFTNATYADVGSGNKCVTTCNFSDLYPFADNTTMKCVDQCPGTVYFADSQLHQCVLNCTLGTYAYSETANHTCVTHCPSPTYGDNTTGTGICVTKCPEQPVMFGDANDARGRVCVYICTSGSFGDETGNRQCKPTCPTIYFAQDDTNRRCVTRCKANTYGMNNYCWTSSTCPSGFGDDTTNLCVSPCPYLNVTYGDSISGMCVKTCPNVTGASPMIYFADPSTRLCTSTCSSTASPPLFGNNNTQTCLSKCVDVGSFADAQSTRRYCIATCTWSGATIYYRNHHTKICVISSGCPINYFGDNSTLDCVFSCPMVNGNQTWGYYTTRTCLQQCYSSTWGDASSGLAICVGLCPSVPPKWSYDGNMTCMSTCPTTPSLYGEDFTRTCIGTCPFSGQLSAAATYDTYSYEPTRRCLKVCPDNYFGDVVARKCWPDPSSCPATAQWGDPSTHMCTSLCTAPPVMDSYGDNATHLCTTFCTSGTYADNFTGTRTCVSVCPGAYDSYGDPDTRSCLLHCVTPLTWANSLTHMCEYTCTGTRYAEDLTRTCVVALDCPTVPAYLFGDSNTWHCVESCLYTNSAVEWADNTTRTCVTQCPNTTNTRFYGDDSTGVPICVTTCPISPVLFGLNSTNRCVPQCPSGLYGDQNFNRSCLTLCPTISGTVWFSQITSQICVTVCQNYTYGNYNNQHCEVTPFDCPSGLFGDDSTHLCVSPCPVSMNFFGDSSTKLCVNRCPNVTVAVVNASAGINEPVGIRYSDVSTRLCVETCPETYGLHGTFGDNFTNNCVEVCPSGTYGDAQTTHRVCVLHCSQLQKSFADSSTNRCVAKCPSSPPLYGETTTFTCVATCTGSTYKNAVNRECVADCPAGQFRSIWPQNICVDVCPINPDSFGDSSTNDCVLSCASGFANTVTRLCVAGCSPLFEYNGRCVNYCPDGYYSNASNNCVGPTSCGATRFAQNSSRTCQLTCGEGYADSASRYCIGVCPTGTYGDVNECVNPCTTPSTSASNVWNLCVATCPPFTYSDGTNCVTGCTSPDYADDYTQTCTPLCPTSSQSTYGSSTLHKCVAVCPATYFRDVTQVCKNNCNPRFADNITLNCEVQCSVGSWGDKNSWSCLSSCVAGEYGYTVDRICYTPTQLAGISVTGLFGDPVSKTYVATCQLSPFLYFGDPNTGTCVSVCPNITVSGSTTIYYGDPHTRNCETSCNNLTYSADPWVNRCLLQCSDGLFSKPGTAGLSPICLATCASGYADPTTRACVSTCPALARSFGFSNTTGGFCLTLCPTSNFAYPIGRVCVTHCTTPYFAYTPTRECVLSCNNSFADPSSGINVCAATCSSASYPYADNSTNMCVPICPTQPDYFASNHVCVYNCPTGQFADPSTRLCVPTCPTLGSGVKTYGDSKTGRCQTSCTIGTYGSNSTMKCVPTCPSGSYADNTTGKCTTDCSASPGTYGDPLTTSCNTVCTGTNFGDSTDYLCRRRCTTPTHGDSLSKTCVSPCPAAGYTFGENGTERLCVTSCLTYTGFADPISRLCRDVCQPNTVPQLYAESTKAECVQKCPNGTYAEDSTFECLAGCLTGFADPSTYRCVPVCPSFPELYGDTALKKCVVSCPTGYYSDNSTNLCVGPTACSVADDYFSDLLTGRCVKFCSEGYWGKLANRTCITFCVDEFADNYTRRCVPVCPGVGAQDTFGDSSSMRCVRICPGSTYAENITKTCQSTCTSGYSDPVSQYCVARCPTKPLSFGYNAICYPVCPTDASGNQLYGDYDTQTCLPACPSVSGVVYYADPFTKTCVTVCPISQNLWADTTNKICRTNCIPTEYRNPATQECVAICPTNPDLYAYTSGDCVRNCLGGTYAETTSRTCQTACSGFAATPYKDNSTYRCVDVCPTKPFYYADNSSWSCVSRCTTGYADNKTQTCVPVCPAIWNYYADIPNSICVQLCPNGTFGVNSTRTCDSGCTSSFADNQTNLCLVNCSTREGYYADDQNWKCVYACPTNAYAHDPDQTCKVNLASGVSTCPGSYYADPTTKKCVLFCPLGRFANTLTKICQTGCTGSYYADNTTRTCVTVCSESPTDLTTYYADPTTHTCVQLCPVGYFSEGRVCSQTCSVLFAYNITRTCEQNCPIPYFADSNLHVCGLTCSAGYASSITRTCVAVNSCPTFTFADNFTMTCVLVCNTGYADSLLKVCVIDCTGGTFADPSTLTCVADCPAQPELWADSLVMRCVQTCTSNSYFRYNKLRICSNGCPNDTSVTPTAIYYADTSTHNCVLQCPIGLSTYADNVTNLCTGLCTSGTFASDLTKQCVLTCPNTPVPTFAHSSTRQCQQVCQTGFGDPISATCVPTCPSGSWGDPLAKLCVTFCPNDYYAYNTSQLCLYLTCNIVSDLYADNTTHTCVSVCPASADLFGDPTSGKCVLYCPTNRYADTVTQSCVTNCNSAPRLYAYDLTNECLQACPAPYIAFDVNNKCILTCPSPYFKNLTSNACSLCPNECLECITFEECTSCKTGYKLFSGVCNSSCSLSSPLVYANPLTDSCIIAMLCPSGYFGNNASLVCTQTCPAKTYGQPTTKVCENCPQSCATCTSPTSCQTCQGSAVLASDSMCYFQCSPTRIYNYNGQCYDACPSGTYLTSNNIICANCASMCLTCSGTSTNCLSCLGMFNYLGSCLTVCPSGYYGATNYTCQLCTNTTPSCVVPVNFTSALAVEDYKYVMYITFNQEVVFSKSIDVLMDIKLVLSRLLATIADYVNSGIPFTFTILPNGTIRAVLSVDMTLLSPKFMVVFNDPNSIVAKNNNGTLQNVINTLSITSVDYYSPDIGSNAGTNTLTLFMAVLLLIFVFLGWLCVPLSFMHSLHTFQLIYLHIYVNYLMPANLYYYLKGLQLTVFSFLPNILAKGLPAGYLNINVPQRIVDLHGDFNFSRNAGSVLFVVLIYLVIGGLISMLSTRIIPNRVWRNLFSGMLQQRILYSAFHEIGFMFFLNVLFFGFMQFKDMTAPVPYEGFNIFVMLLFVIGMLVLPFAFLIKLIKHREDLEPIHDNFEFAYRFHKTEGVSLYFTLIYYFRGILFVVFLTALFSYPLGQLISLMLINLALLIMLLVVRPYKEVSVNVMHVLFELSLLFIEGLMTYGYFNPQLSVTSKVNYGYIGIVTLGVLLTIFALWNIFRWAVGIKAFWDMFKQTEFYREYADDDYVNEIEDEFIEVQKKPVVEMTQGDITIEKIYKELNEDGTVTIKIKKKKKKLRPKKKKKVQPQDAQLFEELEEEERAEVKKDSPYVRINPQNIFDLKTNNVALPVLNRHFEQEPQKDEEQQQHEPAIMSSADDDERPASVYSEQERNHNRSIEHLSIERHSIEHLPQEPGEEHKQPLVVEEPIKHTEEEHNASPRQRGSYRPNNNIILFEEALNELAEQQVDLNLKQSQSHPWRPSANLELVQLDNDSPRVPAREQQPKQEHKIGHFFDDLLSEEASNEPHGDIFSAESKPQQVQQAQQGLFGEEEVASELAREQQARKKNNVNFLFEDLE